MFPVANPKFTGEPRPMRSIPKGRVYDILGRPMSTLEPRTANAIFIDGRDEAARLKKLSQAAI